MKIAYDDLKALVKEALVEILQEGLGNLLTSKSSRHEEDEFEDVPPPKAKSTMAPKPQTMKAVSAPFNKQVTSESKQKVPSLTSMYEAKTLQKMGEQLNKQKVDNKVAINKMTDDPLMASIFADTAKTTLVEQIDAEKRGGSSIVGGDAASYAAAQSDPLDLFGDVAGNWEKMAFSSNDLIKKK
jgi:hypothetical protein